MSDTVQHENICRTTEAQQGGASVIKYLMIGAAILGVAALIAYQLFACSACYG